MMKNKTVSSKGVVPSRVLVGKIHEGPLGKKRSEKNSTIEQHHHDPTKGTNSLSEIWHNKAPPLVILIYWQT